MSLHQSLKLKNKLKRQRNVLTRLERLEKMADEERWNEGDSIFGLPTLKVVKIRTGKKKKKETPEEEEELAAEEPEE